MNKIIETDFTTRKTQNNADVENPIFCPSCLNNDCIELIDEGNEEDSDGIFGNFYFHCSVCGRRTDSMDTPKDALESWQTHDVNYIGSHAILMPIENLRKLCKNGKDCCRICHDCEIAHELRVMD